EGDGLDRARMAGEGMEDAAGGQLPDLERAVGAGGDGAGTIGGEGDGGDRARMPGEGMEHASRGENPDFERLGVAGTNRTRCGRQTTTGTPDHKRPGRSFEPAAAS